jgi:hypothetical protein
MSLWPQFLKACSRNECWPKVIWPLCKENQITIKYASSVPLYFPPKRNVHRSSDHEVLPGQFFRKCPNLLQKLQRLWHSAQTCLSPQNPHGKWLDLTDSANFLLASSSIASRIPRAVRSLNQSIVGSAKLVFRLSWTPRTFNVGIIRILFSRKGSIASSWVAGTISLSRIVGWA